MSNISSKLLLELILPIACWWLKREEARIQREGVPLDSDLIESARRIGVAFPERVRLSFVEQVPRMHPWLLAVANQVGLCSPSTTGMSLRYGIFVRSDFRGDRRLVIHELAHTRQYERLGGIRPFLREYLYECLVTPGYPFGPLEQEAIEVEGRGH